MSDGCRQSARTFLPLLFGTDVDFALLSEWTDMFRIRLSDAKDSTIPRISKISLEASDRVFSDKGASTMPVHAHVVTNSVTTWTVSLLIIFHILFICSSHFSDRLRLY